MASCMLSTPVVSGGPSQKTCTALDVVRSIRPVEFESHAQYSIHDELDVKCREAITREASPTAAVINDRSIKSAWKIQLIPPGYDAGKKIKGKKRHIMINARGLGIDAMVHAADVQVATAPHLVMATMFGMYPFLMKELYADGGYRGPLFRRAVAKIMARVNMRRSSDVPITQKDLWSFAEPWVVERSLAWLRQCRHPRQRLEDLDRKALAFLRLSWIGVVLRSLCDPA